MTSSEPNASKSICIACAKDSSLAEFIIENREEGFACAICGRISPMVSSPNKVEELSNLISALVRFYYDEFEYNPHWGGEDSPIELLMKQNPIIKSHGEAESTCEEEDTELFFRNVVFGRSMPAYDEGVWVYAGHDENGIRGLNSALSKHAAPALVDLAWRLKRENYFEVHPELRELLLEIRNELSTVVPAESQFFRARIGVSGTYIENALRYAKPFFFHPLQGEALGAPPPNVASSGRANRQGVSYLYLASDAATAAAEVRPHPGHKISVGQFSVLEDLEIADFDVNIKDFSSSDKLLAKFHLLYSISRALSMPITPEERDRYTITQLIADVIREIGFDGLRFQSSVEEGSNYCVFYPSKLNFVQGTEKVIEVTRLKYETIELPMIADPDDDDFYELKGANPLMF